MKAPIDFFIAHLTAQNMQPMTLQQYGSFLIRFDRYLDQTYGLKLTPEDISKITGAHLSTYMQELTSLNRKISTRNNYIIILRRFFSCMKEAGFITDDPSRILHSAREKMTPELRRERSEKRYTTQDIALLLEEMLGEHPRMTDLRDAAILALILASGLRASEVCALDVRQLQEMKAGVLFCLRKGGDWEEVSVAAFAIPYIERYLSARNQPGGNTPMFVSQKGTRLTRQAMWESFHAKQQRANLKSGIHILRHTLVTFVDHNGGSAIARDVAGHSSVRITDGYMHTSIDERREAISAAPYVAQLEKQLQTSQFYLVSLRYCFGEFNKEPGHIAKVCCSYMPRGFFGHPSAEKGPLWGRYLDAIICPAGITSIVRYCRIYIHYCKNLLKLPVL